MEKVFSAGAAVALSVSWATACVLIYRNAIPINNRLQFSVQIMVLPIYAKRKLLFYCDYIEAVLLFCKNTES
jgi:hypothetical protein